MRYISLELLEENLRKEKDAELVTTAPQGFDEKFFASFLRILLSNVDEVDDIDSELIVEMLEKGSELFETLSLDDKTLSSMFTRLNACTSNIVARKRRIL